MNKPPTHRILVGNQRERTTLGRGFLSFHIYFGDNSVFVQMSSGPKTFLYISSVFFRSLIGNFLSFFPFLFFSFSPPPFCFLLRARFMVSWDFGSRLVERMDMIYVRALVWPAVQG